MKRKIYLLPVVLLAVLILSGCSSKNNENNNTTLEDGEVIIDLSDENSSAEYEATMEEMFLKGKSLKCTMSDKSEDVEIDAVYYIDGKKERFRAEAKMTASALGEPINSVSIVKDGYTYIWDDLTNTDGSKFKIEDEEDDYDEYDNDFGFEEESDDLDLDEKMNLKCTSWKVDNDMFDLPKDKTFNDMSDLSNSFNDMSDVDMEFDADGEMDYCSICNMIPEGEDRDECLSACK